MKPGKVSIKGDFSPWKEFIDLCSLAEGSGKTRSTIHKHKIYCYLQEDAHFKLALATFETIRSRKDKKAPICDSSAEFAFLRIIALHIGRFTVTKGSVYEPRYPTPKERIAAIGHIRQVLDDMDHRGVGLPGFHEQLELQNNLTRTYLKIEKRLN